MKTLSEITLFLQKHNNPYENTYGDDQCILVIKKLHEYLEEYPDVYYRFNGAYTLPAYKSEKYALFYIKDMEIFRHLLKEKRYNAFIHEVYDFFNYKILKDDIMDKSIELPVNIKNALIFTIKENFIEI